jgi:hypothetical protein
MAGLPHRFTLQDEEMSRVIFPIDNDDPVRALLDYGRPLDDPSSNYVFEDRGPGWEQIIRIQRLADGTRRLVVGARRIPD